MSHEVSLFQQEKENSAEAYKEHLTARKRERKRVEDITNWPFHIPREIMDVILASTDLGVREHLALAATCTSLRRMYYKDDVFKAVVECRFVPVNGLGRYARRYGDDKILRHLATKP